MVLRNSSTKFQTPYLDSSFSSIKSSSQSVNSKSMSEQMEMIQDYFKKIDGSPEAANSFKETFSKVHHCDVVFEFPEGELDYDGALPAFQAAVNKGAYANLLDIHDNGDGTAKTTVYLHLPGGSPFDNGDDMVSQRIVSFKDGKIVRLRSIDTDLDKLAALLKRSMKFPYNELADKWVNMIACFDGKPDAFAKAEPIIDEISDRGLVIDHGIEGTCKDFDGFKEWAATFSKEHNVARLEGEVEIDDDGKIRATIRNIVDGIDQGPVTQVGIAKNGKFVHWSAVSSSSDEAGFDKLISSVAAKGEGMTGNIQRLRNYFSALDGSPDAWEKFKPHIDGVLSPYFTLESGDGRVIDYDDLLALIRFKYIPNGCYPVIESVEVNDDGRSLAVVINNHLPGEDGDATRQVVYYGDDDLVYRVTSAPLFETFARVAALPSGD